MFGLRPIWNNICHLNESMHSFNRPVHRFRKSIERNSFCIQTCLNKVRRCQSSQNCKCYQSNCQSQRCQGCQRCQSCQTCQDCHSKRARAVGGEAKAAIAFHDLTENKTLGWKKTEPNRFQLKLFFEISLQSLRNLIKKLFLGAICFLMPVLGKLVV